jgi:hypothetical protein
MKNNKVLRSNIRASVRNYARFNRWDSSSVDKCVDAIIDHFELQLPTEEEIANAAINYANHRNSLDFESYWDAMIDGYVTAYRDIMANLK